jgi:hypothetical protein
VCGGAPRFLKPCRFRHWVTTAGLPTPTTAPISLSVLSAQSAGNLAQSCLAFPLGRRLNPRPSLLSSMAAFRIPQPASLANSGSVLPSVFIAARRSSEVTAVRLRNRGDLAPFPSRGSFRACLTRSRVQPSSAARATSCFRQSAFDQSTLNPLPMFDAIPSALFGCHIPCRPRLECSTNPKGNPS